MDDQRDYAEEAANREHVESEYAAEQAAEDQATATIDNA